MVEEWRKNLRSLNTSGKTKKKRVTEPKAARKPQRSLLESLGSGIVRTGQEAVGDVPEIISGIGQGFGAFGRASSRTIFGDPGQRALDRQLQAGDISKEDFKAQSLQRGLGNLGQDVEGALGVLPFIPGLGIGKALLGLGAVQTGQSVSEKGLGRTLQEDPLKIGLLALGTRFEAKAFRGKRATARGSRAIRDAEAARTKLANERGLPSQGTRTATALGEEATLPPLESNVTKQPTALNKALGITEEAFGTEASKLLGRRPIRSVEDLAPLPPRPITINRGKQQIAPKQPGPSSPGGLSRAADAAITNKTTRSFVDNLPEREVLTKAAAIDRGIAIKPNGQPYIRKSGEAVSQNFVNWYKGVAKESKPGHRESLPITHFTLTADNVPISDVYGGPIYKSILEPTRAATLARDTAIETRLGQFNNITRKNRVKDQVRAGEVLEKVGDAELNTPAEFLATTKDFKKFQPNEITWAQEVRAMLNDIHQEANIGRLKAGRPEIGFIPKYMSHMKQRNTVWDDFVARMKNNEVDIDGRAPLPDFIHPNAPANPHAKTRTGEGNRYNRDAFDVVDGYIRNMERDIYNTPIIENIKVHADAIRDIGNPINARYLQSWASEAFAGVPGAIDRAISLTPRQTRGLDTARGALHKAVFPFNFAWNGFVQTSSTALTAARYGRHLVPGALDWFGSKKFRQQLFDETYSLQMKGRQRGSAIYQDLDKPIRLDRFSKFERVEQVGSYLGRVIEHNLTGMSAAAARRKGLAKGLKGQDLRSFQSDGGALTQSMYNIEDLPGNLRNKSLKTAIPFQSFSHELFNLAREVAGRVGTPKKVSERLGIGLRLFGAAMVVNSITDKAIGRELFGAESFVPFAGPVLAGAKRKLEGKDFGGNNPIILANIAEGVMEGFADYLGSGDSKKLRRALITYGTAAGGIPGGVQLNRVYETIEAIGNGGDVLNVQGEAKFNIEGDVGRSLLLGPSKTQAGREFSESFRRDTPLQRFRERTSGSQETPTSSFRFRGR